MSAVAATASVTEKKVITHRFPNEHANSKLSINSIYGNVNVTQANQDYIDIRVEVEAKARNSESAQRILDRISVNFSGKGTGCSARTEIAKKNNSNNESFEIRYIVTIPVGAKLDIVNKYGNVILGNLDGTFTTDLQYGNLNSGELNARGNRINIKYGNANITNTPDLNLSLAYGNLKAINIADLKISTSYSNVTADYLGNTTVSASKYDNYKIDKVHTFTSSSSTSGLQIGTLIKSLTIKGGKYGDISIDNVQPGFDAINISASYSNIRIRFTEPKFGYDLKSNYGDVKLTDLDYKNRVEIRGYTDVKLEGSAGGYSGEPNVNISANYGAISLRGK